MTTSIKLQLGSTVIYKNETWLAVAYDGVSKLTIMQPNKGNVKRTINPKSLTAVTNVIGAQLYEVENLTNTQLGLRYLVTSKGYIISKKTLKLINCVKLKCQIMSSVGTTLVS
ncbi:hypothetical protein [Alteromonas sp. BMJM2]|uniref:hypothetical protein n=1 Tax=Alteromonas sp. BMJM2 TaxID=2954241 RepID=UPI0022B58C31|nr:hypothetical protein [Alteromonas sp. BMJM2]